MLIMRRVNGLGLDPAAARSLLSAMSAAGYNMPATLAPATMPASSGWTAPPPNPALDTSQCPCMVQRMAQVMSADLPTQNAMAQVCASDPAGFQQRVLQAGVADFSCPDASALTPWYQKPATWVLGGAIVLVGALVIKAAL